MSKPAPLPPSRRSDARVSSIAVATLLTAACFRYNPASRPDGDGSDAPISESGTFDTQNDRAMPDSNVVDDVQALDDVRAMDDGAALDASAMPDAATADAADVFTANDARADSATDADACVTPDASSADSGVAMGNCAVNNGGCSAFAQCQQFCGGMRRCECGSGLTLGADGASCSGLVLVSKTSIVMAGTNFDTTSFDLSISRTGRYVGFVSVVETALRTQRCFAANIATGALNEISATRDAMGREQRPEGCFAPLVTEDGSRALFVTRGLHPGDPEAAPMWPVSVITTTPWPYYRDNNGTPTRVNVWQNGMPVSPLREGFNNFVFARDGRRMAFSTREQVDPVLRPGDNMDFYSASIPILMHEPLYENVNDNRTIAPFPSGPSNSRDLDLAGDGVTLLFGTARRINGETHPGTDNFARRIGSTSTTNPTINVTPDPSASGDSRFPTGSLDASTVCFVSTSPGVGVPGSATEYVLSVRSGGARVFRRLSVPVPPTGALAASLSDDGRWLVLATNAAIAIAGQPSDTNNALDYYLFDVADPAMPIPVQRLSLTRTGTQAMIGHTGGSQARLAGDGNSVVFTTTQQLVPEDNNGAGMDVYLRVFR